MFAIPELLGGTRDLLIGNLIKEQFLDNRDWPLGSTLSLLLTAAVLVLAALSVVGRRARARMSGHDRAARRGCGWLQLTVYAFLYVPLAVVVLFSFNDSLLNAQWVGFTTRWYRKLLHDEARCWRSRQLAVHRPHRGSVSPPCSAPWPGIAMQRWPVGLLRSCLSSC
jgi:ABC-type Fe3+ transport system permease subunit